MYKIKIESFEGPLRLLLQLIERERFDITKVSLTQITDQYLDYIKQIEKKNPEEMADFLIVATKLIYIKSKTLLPNLDLGIEEDETSLEEQLKMYREFVLASKNVEKIIEQKKFSFVRDKILIQENIFSPPNVLNKDILEKIFSEVISLVKPILKLPEQAIKKAISIQEKVDYLHKLIKQKSSLVFNKVFKNTKANTEIVVGFLALLELIKKRFVVAKQNKLFENIIVKKNED